MHRDNAFEVLSSFIAIILILGIMGISYLSSEFVDRYLGINGFGPERYYSVLVTNKHVDAQKDSSSYMVTTSYDGAPKVFEVDNGVRLGIWNADEIYGLIVIGERYCFVAKGNEVTNFWRQQYPYILKVQKGGCNGT